VTGPHRILSVLAGLAVVGASVLAAGSASAAPSVLHSDTSDFSFSSFSADYYLGRDAEGHSTLRTVEKLTAVFPQSDQNRGIERAIPDSYNGEPLNTRFVSVSDTNGVTKPYDVSDDGDFTTVSTGTDDYVHGHVTYTLTYTQENVAGSFSDTNDDEFYWDTNGTGWDQPFGSVTARVHVDPSLVGALTGHNACYRGAQGSTDKCTITGPPVSTATLAPTGTPSDAVFTASTGRLAAGENMSVVLGFTAGTFVQAPKQDSNDYSGTLLATHPWSEIVGAILAFLGVAGLAFALVRRFAFGQRDSKGRGIIVPQYDVPRGINLLDAAAIVGRQSTAISAQIVSFAVRGNLRILDYPVTASGASYSLELLHTNDVDAAEGQFLASLFPGLAPGAVREIVADTTLATELTALKASASQSLVARGLRVKASALGGVLVGLALLALLLIEGVFLIVLAGVQNSTSVWGIVALPITFVAMLVAFGVAYRRPVLSDAGAEQRDYLLGLRDYLQLAEQDRLRMLQSPTGAERIDYGDKREVVKLYEKLLPYAVLWGVENQWSAELAIHYSEVQGSPNWFIGTSAFNANLFAASLVGMSSAVTTSTTPVSAMGSGGGSSFGGSFGGGFSGGGGGGGGGGGR
jgi:uncharacterized membrane protein YgcG